MKKVFFLFLLISPFISVSQEAQVLYKLVELPRSVNSRYHESAPLVTPDNQRLYFTVSNHPQNNAGVDNSQDIWYADKQTDGHWGPAIHMKAPLNHRKFNQVLTVLDNGNTLFIRGGNRKKEEGFSLTFKDGDSWSRPTEFEIEGFEEMNKGRFSGAAISQDRTAIIIYMNEREAKPYSDLYLSMLQDDGKYSKPKLIEQLSTYKDEFGPYFSENDQMMYYASNRDGSIGGVDIWKTTRLDTTWLNWSEPENIGAPINTGGFDSYFSIDASGQNAFTTRTYVSADGSNMNIYGLVPKAKITVQGKVLDAETKEPLNILLAISANEEKIKNIQTKNNGQYEFTTYQEKVYRYGGAIIGYEQLEDHLDLSRIEKDTVIEKDVYLTPIVAELILNGYVTDSTSLLPANAWLIIEKGQFIDSVQTAYSDGGYTLELQGEGTYNISLVSNDYETISDTLIAKVTTGIYYKEFRKDYTLKKKIKPYVLSGYVYDEQTKVPLSVTLNVELPDSSKSTTSSDESGYYEINTKIAGEIIIRAQKVNYLNLEDNLTIGDDQLFLNYTRDLYMSSIAVGKTVIINNIYFNFDKSSLKEASFPELGRLTDLLNQNPSITIEISGHTDDKGSDDYNLSLSEGRAESVMGYLLDQGIAGQRMKAKGYGEAKPISSNLSESGRAENRRVEFTILSVD
jgi:OOP family OmpA-OmpF porin